MQRKRLRYSILTKICGLLFLSLIFFVGAFGVFRFEILTYAWHVKYPNPVLWNGLKITIPKTMIAKKFSDGIAIYSLFSGSNSSVHIGKQSSNLIPSLKRILNSDGYKLEEKSCNIAQRNCIWIKAFSKKENKIYTETIQFYDPEIKISFKGPKKQRYYLLEITESLEIISQPKQRVH